ncbi:MAG: hypothetical protein J6T88_01420 [Bacteroidales bacterium]|nr:hypothetical protein [Bacteroidales bacterium]
MKKSTFFVSFILLAMFAFTSCEEMSIDFDDLTSDALVGNAAIEITHNGTDGIVTDSMNFKSSIADAFDLSDFDSNLVEGYSTVSISANVNLNDANIELAFPFMYYRINDTLAGTYEFDTILTIEMLHNLNFDTLVNVLANPDGGNMILIAENDSCWYITFDGSLVVTQYPTVGHLIEATVNNASAWYVTQSKVNELSADIDNMNLAHLNDLEYYFPRVSLTGAITSRRWAVTQTIFNTAFRQGGISSK